MNNVDDLIRSFGMSGFLVTEDLREVEKQLGIELGHISPKATESVVDYYPQFEKRVRVEAQYGSTL